MRFWAKKRLLSTLAFAVLLVSTTADADDGTRQAYDAALKCFVASGLASTDSQDLGKGDKAAKYDSKAHTSFDLAVKFGKELGYSSKRINDDFASVQASELPRMMHDNNYYRSAVSTCKALGLM